MSATSRGDVGDEHPSPSGVPGAAGATPVSHDSPTIPAEADEVRFGSVTLSPDTPDSFGPYKVLKKLGEGGFGIVYACEQREPIRRQVALKVIKLGMDTREVIARFEAERQALAVMEHPNVAKVLDAGVTERGRPYFVMEYVAGMAITEYCDRSQLTMRERLALFIQVCQAVQHAHQKGIIHRDLKPSNVLVTLIDGKPVPKVIDFGIAKATGQHLTERTMFTEAGRLIGTPEYMSPEQAGLSELDVDTRTDIYALGVLLYELLAGVLPHEPKRLRRAALTEIQRIIREEEPPKPSTRLGQLGSSEPSEPADVTPAAIAQRRRMEPAQLVRELRGDLDWITMKAMEKDRTRRYDTAAALAADIEHYLRNEPVLAGPPSATYRMRKFARRHRAAVAVGSVFALMVVGGIMALSAAYGQAETQRRLAVEAGAVADRERLEAIAARELAEEQRRIAESEKDRADRERQAAVDAMNRAEAEKARADAEARKATEAFMFLSGMFGSIDPAKSKGREVTVREVLDQADERMKGAQDASPELEATVREFFAMAYHVLGEFDRAEENMRRALTIREKINGPDSAEALQDAHNLGATLASRGRFEESLALMRRAADGRRTLFGDKNQDTLASMSLLVYLTQNMGDMAGAEKLARDVIAAQTDLLGPGHRDTIDSRLSLADILHQMGRFDDAEAYSRDLIETAARSLGADDPLTLTAMSIRGALLDDMGRFEEAEQLLKTTLDMKIRVFGEGHKEVMTTRNSYARVLEMLTREAEAEEQFRIVLESSRARLGMEHDQTLSALNNLAQLLRRAKRFDESEKMLRESLELNKKATGAESIATATAEVNLAMLLRDTGRHGEALLQLEHAYASLHKAIGPAHWKTALTRGYIGEAMMELGRLTDAEKPLLESHEGLSKALGPTHDRTRQIAGVVATLYEKLGKPAERDTWLERAKQPAQ